GQVEADLLQVPAIAKSDRCLRVDADASRIDHSNDLQESVSGEPADPIADGVGREPDLGGDAPETSPSILLQGSNNGFVELVKLARRPCSLPQAEPRSTAPFSNRRPKSCITSRCSFSYLTLIRSWRANATARPFTGQS
ncbi:MAG TPA: hypothetical protein VKU92_10320, partial [Acidimicrobiales bacterium]|nr:hypothetical protein [Acidimicrobiales bacterium]